MGQLFTRRIRIFHPMLELGVYFPQIMGKGSQGKHLPGSQPFLDISMLRQLQGLTTNPLQMIP